MKNKNFFLYIMPIFLVVFFLITKNIESNFEKYEISKIDQKKIEYFIKDYIYQYNQAILLGGNNITHLNKFLEKDIMFYKELRKEFLISKNRNEYKDEYIKILIPNKLEIKKITEEDNYFRVKVVIMCKIKKVFNSNSDSEYSITYSRYAKEYLEFIILKKYNNDGTYSFVIDRFENKKIL